MMVIMKRLYIRPMIEVNLLSMESTFMAGSPFNSQNGGLEKDQNDDGGSCAKKFDFWSFEEEESAKPSHDVLSDSF